MSPQSGRWLGLDIGGTTVKAGVVEPDGSWERSPEVLPTELAGGPAPFLDALAEFARGFGPVDGIGIGCPGVFDPATGALRASANLQPLVVILGPELEQRLGLLAGLGPRGQRRQPRRVWRAVEGRRRRARRPVPRHPRDGDRRRHDPGRTSLRRDARDGLRDRAPRGRPARAGRAALRMWERWLPGDLRLGDPRATEGPRGRPDRRPRRTVRPAAARRRDRSARCCMRLAGTWAAASPTSSPSST